MPRGVKTCPKCKETTGPRTIICKCGHTWETAKQKESKTEEEVIRSITNPAPFPVLVIAPAKDQLKCPYPLTDFSDTGIINWLDKMIEYRKITPNGMLGYSRQGIIYLMQLQLKPWKYSEFNRISAIIRRNMAPYGNE